MITNLSLTNFKGVSANYTFGSGTLIQGRNFSGKSAIDQAIRLLILGYVPDSSKTASGIKMFASGYPMALAAQVNGTMPAKQLGITFDKVKSTVKQTLDANLGPELDEATRVLFDPSIFFNLGDAARITKACELVQSQGVSADDIDAALVGVINDNPALLNHLKTWRDTVKTKAKTISDLLGESDTFWKEQRKIVNAEKARMQSTVEGVADLNAADAKALPPRHEVEAYRASNEAELLTLRNRISAAEALIAHANKIQLRRAEITPIAAALADKIALEAKWVAEVAAAESKVESTSEDYSQKSNELHRLQRLISEANASHSRRAQLTQEAAKVDGLKQEIASLESSIATIEKEIEEIAVNVANAKAVLEKAQAEANAPKPVQAESEVRTDDFSTGAMIGTKYLATCVISLGEDGVVIDSIEDWRGLAKDTDESEEQARLKEYELAQAVSEAADDLLFHTESLAGKQADLKHAQNSLNAYSTLLTRSTVAAENLALLTEANPAPTPAELATASHAEAAAAQAVSAAKSNLHNLRTDHMKARDALASARAASEELARLDTADQAATPNAAEIEALKQEVEIKANAVREANATLSEITAAEQDQKRITEAAKKREAVEAEYKLMGKVLDVLTQKKTELVSGSIEAPLAVANKLGAGILKGKLVFEEGEIGMRCGDSFVSARVFSGTETAIVMMGLTAGLANKSKLRVLMLDEIGRLDLANAQKLITNLCGMVDDGDIDQFIVIGPENEALRKQLVAEIASSRLSVIDV